MISQDHAVGICHQEQTQAYQNMFVKYVKFLYETYIEYRNILLDDNDMLYNIISRTTCPLSAINCFMSLEPVGKQQYETFVRERLVDRVVSIKTIIKNKKSDLMKSPKDLKSKISEVKELMN